MRFSVDATTATLGAATIDLTMGAGEIAVTSLGLAPIAIKQGELRGTVRGGWAGADIERLQLVADGFTLGASGTVAVVDGDVAANIALDAKELDVGEVLQLWPTAVAAGARDWIAANIAAGQLAAVTLQLDQRGARPDQPKLGGTFTFNGAQVRYLDTFPPATGVVGTASLAGNSLAVKLSAGRTGEVDLTRARSRSPI